MARVTLILSTVLFAAGLLFSPQAAAQAARESLALCGQVVLPSLFPFFILSNLALGLGFGQWLGKKLAPLMGPLFHVGGAGGAALALGLVGGYPVGAATVRALLEDGACSPREAQSLLRFCNNAGPGFLLSFVGGSILGSVSLGGLLLAVHALAALGTGILLRDPRPPAPRDPCASPEPPRSSPAALLPGAVSRALSSALQVSAYVVLFGILLGLLHPLVDCLPPLCAVLLAGSLELTNGIAGLTQITSPSLRLILAGLLLGWGGLSVHGQTAALLEGTGLDLLPYLRAKALQGLLSAGGLALFALICPTLAASLGAGETVSLAQLFPHSLVAGGVLWLAILVLLTKGGGKSPPAQV